MSATATATAQAGTSLSEKQSRILEYLRENADTQTYFKSRLIGDALDLSAKEVGTNMPAIEKGDFDIEVEKWGYSSSTTWKVTA
ncbi:hypothetical protein BV210_05375 [Halorientalis sp. IM1011]|uniref:DUF7123 family protein n=1 Tax=Halorientalis sp. IM1011 TaxID=1932360 RepID=UPI00097CD445|nr:hypothetical protein [Halorientalis sp. IM1011]AQL42176.1 hypothetical protein BV210_05375 [Halorientalis sp. IM1011]